MNRSEAAQSRHVHGVMWKSGKAGMVRHERRGTKEHRRCWRVRQELPEWTTAGNTEAKTRTMADVAEPERATNGAQKIA
ncbi:hypothetical protein R1flu_014424 [Riccia fluitans]|uniref:Uncharacterized protein n=1 Tax=Riccia fluitans TaxID=41844 RepID=A0ABD1YGE6_9MARC